MTERLGSHLEKTYGIRVDGVTPIEGGTLYKIVRSDGHDWVTRPFPAERKLARKFGLVRFPDEGFLFTGDPAGGRPLLRRLAMAASSP